MSEFDRCPSGAIEKDVLLSAYDKGGQSSVYAHTNEYHPNWSWSLCESCEDTTPTWDGVCAVCWSAKPERPLTRGIMAQNAMYEPERRTLIRRRADRASAGVLRGEVSPYMGEIVEVKEA